MDARTKGTFHSGCGKGVELSEDRLIASGDHPKSFCITLSNYPILIGLKFSVKILQCSRSVSPISAASTLTHVAEVTLAN